MSIRVITFDLDDTLWETSSTLHNASRVMFDYIQEKGFRFNFDIPSFDQLLRKTMKEEPTKSHDFTWGRLASLEKAFLASGYTLEESRTIAEEVFHVWHEERHKVLFFEDSLPALEKLRNFSPKSLEQSRDSATYLEDRQNAITWTSGNQETDEQACIQSQSEELDEGATPVIKQSKLEESVLIGALTNGNACVWRIGLRHIFHFKLNAREAGAAKPDPAFFNKAVSIIESHHHTSCPNSSALDSHLAVTEDGLINITVETSNCCQKLSVKPSQILHVGDNPTDDIMGAKKMGFRTCWVNRKGEQWPTSLNEWQPDVVISNLWELLDWLKAEGSTGEVLSSL
eukprot:TRINITY_DN7157_c0_g1_i1.p1 TRINITY_DN7157_c0_g1~~TRINITY_DN7157_c0_g1_i1.p1  ORF type:complete len:342 (+),score=52.11 TRINITY_DN7157_c0_g1_i1:85-1110(+)